MFNNYLRNEQTEPFSLSLTCIALLHYGLFRKTLCVAISLAVETAPSVKNQQLKNYIILKIVRAEDSREPKYYTAEV